MSINTTFVPTQVKRFECKNSQIGLQWNDGNQLNIIIQTKRLYIRSILHKDLDNCAKLYEDKTVMGLVSNRVIKDKTHVENKLNTLWLVRWQNNIPYSQFAAFDSDTKAFIGIGMLRLCQKPGTVELSCLIAPPFQKKGYATEAGWTLVHELAPILKQEGFLVPIYDAAGNRVSASPLNRIIATAWKANSTSVATLQKIGMHREEERMSIGSSIQEMVVPFSIDLEELQREQNFQQSKYVYSL